MSSRTLYAKANKIRKDAHVLTAHKLKPNASKKEKENYLKIRAYHSAYKSVQFIAKELNMAEDDVRAYLHFCGSTPIEERKKKRGRPRKN